jgi:hypothetical protein
MSAYNVHPHPFANESVGPGFAFTSNHAHREVDIFVLSTTGVRLGFVEAVYPFQGLYDVHLMAVDHSLPAGTGNRPLAEIVTRHYGEVVLVCETAEQVVNCRELFKGAVRLRAALDSELEFADEGGRVALSVSPEELAAVDAMNLGMHRANRIRQGPRLSRDYYGSINPLFWDT